MNAHLSFARFKLQTDMLSSREKPVSEKEYFELAREAVLLHDKQPSLSDIIAYQMVCVGSNLKTPCSEAVTETLDWFTDLEVPEAHVDTTGFSTPQAKWDRIREVANNG